MKKYNLILFTFFMVSCLPQLSKQDTPSVCLEGAGRAAFDVDEIKSEFVKRPDSNQSIRDSNFSVTFTACIKDSLKKQPMRNRTFAIHTFSNKKLPDKEIKDTLCDNVEWGCVLKPTDNQGCLKWSEEHGFDRPAEQQWIGFKRVIAHRSGSRVVQMMIKPWVPAGPKVVDIRPQFGDPNNYLADNKTVFYLHEELDKLHEAGRSSIDKCIEEGSLDQAFEYLSDKEGKAYLWVGSIEFTPSRKVHPDISNYKETYNICEDSLSDEDCDKNKDMDRKGGFLDLNLKIPVQISSENESARISRKLVPAGSEFYVTAYLLSEIEGDSGDGNGKKYYMLHRRVKPVRAEAGGEYIHLDNALLHIPYETTEGTSIILLKVESVGEKDMKPFFGVYEMKDKSIRDLHGSSLSLSLKSSESASASGEVDLERIGESKVESERQRITEYKEMFEKYDVENAYAEYAPVVGEDGFDYSKGIALDLKRMRFARINASGECASPVRRGVVYLGEVCLRDPRINQYLEKRPVLVTALDMEIGRDKDGFIFVEETGRKPETIVERLTDENGCIQFTYELSHKLYDIQKYFMKKLTFKSHDQEESKYIALNPWEYGFLTYQEFTQAYENWNKAHKNYIKCKRKSCSENDLSKLKDAESDLAGPLFSENLSSPILRLNEYRNVIIEPSYKVESSLDIQTVKNLQMFLQPTIVRTDSPGESLWQIPRVLPIGYYLVRFIIAKGPQETAEGKRFILNRSLDPFQGSLRFHTDRDRIRREKQFADYFEKYLSSSNQNLSLDALAERDNKLKEQLILMEDFYKETGYGTYRAKLTRANAVEFFGSGCEEKNERIPCFRKGDYIAHFDTLAYAENGALTAFAQFGFNAEHFRHLGSKNSILIELYPTDPGEYQYLPPEYPGANRCRLDIENTAFKPFPECEGDHARSDCHQLKTPAHWGLFFTTEFGMVNITWPTERNYSEVFGLAPIQVLGKDQYQREEEQQQLALIENALENVHDVQSDEGRVHKAYEHFIEQFPVDHLDYVDVDKFNEYCGGVIEKIGKIPSTNLKGVESLPETLALDSYICSANPGTSKKLKGQTIKHRIRQYFTYRDFSEAKKNVDLLQAYRKFESQTGSFCDERSHKATSYIDDGNDFSESSLDYHDCVCGPPNDESLTRKMARCFARTQGLVFVEDNTSFLTSLKNRGFDAEDMVPIVKHTENNSDAFQDFLKSMCPFWFEDYYKNYLTFGHVENLYNKSIPELEFLYSNEYIRIPEEYKLEGVNFDDFQNISQNGSSPAQWLQGKYGTTGDTSANGYNPFTEYGRTSTANHPFFICRNDPEKFFHIEKKVLIGELNTASNKTRYRNGRVYSLTTQASLGAQARVELSERQQIASSIRGEFRVETPKNFIGSWFHKVWSKVNPEMFRATAGAGVGAEAARTGTVSSTEYYTNDSAKSALLAVNHVHIDLDLKTHRSCLLIRPKIDAFDNMSDSQWKDLVVPFWSSVNSNNRPCEAEGCVSLMRAPYTDSGLLICDEESSESLVVPEHYYYIHQFFGGHAYEFMSRTIYHNRPYTEIIRGQDQMGKFISLTHDVTYNKESKVENPYAMNNLIRHLELDRDQIDHNLVEAFEKNSLDVSGFYRGIYTYPSLIHTADTTKSKGLFDRGMDALGNRAAVPAESIHQ